MYGSISEGLSQAAACEREGRFDEAVMVYQRLLAQVPGQTETLHRLGLLAGRARRFDAAIPLLRQAAQQQMGVPMYWASLAEACWNAGEVNGAIEALEHLAVLEPESAQTQYNLALALERAGRIEQAIAGCRQAVALRPDWPEAHNNLGAMLVRSGRADEGIASLERATVLAPGAAAGFINLGDASRGLGRWEDALRAYESAVALKPEQAEIQDRLGTTLTEMGRPDLATPALAEAIRLKPADAEYHDHLATALRAVGRLDEAIAAYRQSLALDANRAQTWSNLGSALKGTGQAPAAIEAFRHAVRLAPDAPAVRSNLIYAMHFDSDCTPEALAGEQALWDRMHGVPLRSNVAPHSNDRDPDRRLRIGYVSPDFYLQAECHFVLPLLENHDRQAVEVHCYSSVARPDEITQRHRKAADHWHEAYGTPAEALAAQIRRDGIDVLVDLTMHMAHNRLPLFARKPAPVQISWLAYPGRTGLQTIDYRLTDASMEPPAVGDDAPAERPLRLPDCWCCYDPVTRCPEVSPAPCAANGYVTFGSLNQFGKVNRRVLRLWSRVLGAVAGSRLVVLSSEGSHRQRMIEELGVDAARVTFVSPRPREQYLELYGLIDVALDPFPYNGITTTCDSLWMGVPVLSIEGPASQPQARAGLSLLTVAGLRSWVAADDDGLVGRAVEVANDLSSLQGLRRMLRDQMRTSPLVDGPRFAQNVEQAYRSAWRGWCSKDSASD